MGCVNHGSVATNNSRKLKFVIVGLEGCGKTSIFEYLRTGRSQPTRPTISVNMDLDRTDYILFDLGGKVPSLWTNYYENLDGLVLVIDSTNKEQLYLVKELLLKLNKDLEYSNAVILVYFTKRDLENAMDSRLLIEESGIYKSLDQDVIVQMCSGKTGDGVKEGITKLLHFIRKQPRHSLNTQSRQLKDRILAN